MSYAIFKPFTQSIPCVCCPVTKCSLTRNRLKTWNLKCVFVTREQSMIVKR